MKLLCFLLFGLTLSSTNSATITQNESKEWTFEKVNGSKLKFRNGREFNTNLFKLKYFGKIEVANKAPYLIFSGRDCDECDANIAIYIHSPSNGLLNIENGQNKYECPGSERDYENNNMLYKARAFYGQVLPGIKGVIWYQKQLTQNNTWQSSTFLVNLNTGAKKEIVLKNTEKLQLTLDLLKKGLCSEIKGLDYHSEP